MAIVKMSKFTLFAFESQKEALLDRLHRFSNVEFSDLQKLEGEEFDFLVRDSEQEKISFLEGQLAKVKFALELLNGYREKPGTIEALVKGKKTLNYEELEVLAEKSKWEEIYKKLKEKDNALVSIKNERSKIHSEIELLTPWLKLDATFSDLKALNSSVFFMGALPKSFKESFREKFESEVPYCYLEVISEIKDEMNIIAIVHKEYEEKAMEMLKLYSFSKINLKIEGSPANVVKKFNEQLNMLQKEESQIKEEIKNSCEHVEELEIVYEYLSNKHIKASACSNFLKTNSVLAIEGWVPTEFSKDLESEIKTILKDDYYLNMEEASKDDLDVPIMLKNNSIVEPFEPITSMYSLPKYSEIDPTPLLTPFYMTFFGMMLADIGYGIVIFLATLFALKKFNLEEGTKKFVKFFMLLSIPTAAAGAVYGSFFGDIIKIPGLLDPSKDLMTILIISIIMGLVQIYFGLGVKAYMLIRDGKPMDAVYDVVTWYLALSGSMLFLAGSKIGLSANAINISKWVMIVGMVGLVLTQGRANKGIGGKLGGGIYGLYGITGYVGDLVSYSRLMALGLAGGFIASSFNQLIRMLPSPFNIIAGIFIFLAAQIFNLLLSSLGAYVHSARLQYVEYFTKFYEGGGKPFRIFKPKNQYINIKK